MVEVPAAGLPQAVLDAFPWRSYETIVGELA